MNLSKTKKITELTTSAFCIFKYAKETSLHVKIVSVTHCPIIIIVSLLIHPKSRKFNPFTSNGSYFLDRKRWCGSLDFLKAPGPTWTSDIGSTPQPISWVLKNWKAITLIDDSLVKTVSDDITFQLATYKCTSSIS